MWVGETTLSIRKVDLTRRTLRAWCSYAEGNAQCTGCSYFAMVMAPGGPSSRHASRGLGRVGQAFTEFIRAENKVGLRERLAMRLELHVGMQGGLG